MKPFYFFKKSETAQQKEERLFRENQENEFKDKINEAITDKIVTVINREGKNLGNMPTQTAIQLAKNAGFDLVKTNIDRKTPPVCKFANSDHYTLRKPSIFLSWLGGFTSFFILFYPFVVIGEKLLEDSAAMLFGFLFILIVSFRVGLTIYTGRLWCRISKQGNIVFLLCLLGFAICALLLGFLEALPIKWSIKNLLSPPIALFTYYFLNKWRNKKLVNN